MFDPFGDFATSGYLRNVASLRDPEEIATVQHSYFVAALDSAVGHLRRQKNIAYADFCEVHRLLFEGFYPWAGCDRLALGVGEYISKAGRVQFECSDRAQAAVEAGLRVGNDRAAMAVRPGHVMGYFAWGHPFLDGNGRTMMVVHAELLHRAGFIVDWSRTRKDEYLEVLTQELLDPRANLLDAYVTPLLLPADPGASWVDQLRGMPSLDGRDSDLSDTVAYGSGDQQAEAEYAEIVRKRGGA